jgi:hypothetical protein
VGAAGDHGRASGLAAVEELSVNESQPKEKTFDCLKYEWEIQAEIYEDIKHPTVEEQLG